MKLSILRWVLFILQVEFVRLYTVTHANNLHTTLFTGYNNLVRPAGYVEAQVEFYLFTVNQLDIKTQSLMSSGWLSVTWNDSRLMWDPASYDNIEFIHVTDAKVWRPELVIDNAMDQISVIQDDNMLFRVKHDGEVKWEPPGVYSTHCDVDITWFPFDKQTCTIELTSWAYTKDFLNLTHIGSSMNTDDYRQNGEWDLIKTELTRTDLVQNNEIFSQLDFVITVERKVAYYLLNIIFPTVLTSVLITIVFLLPADSGERISYALTVLLALAVVLSIIANSMPTTSLHTSVLGMYLVITLGESTLAVIFTVLVLRLHHKKDQTDVPKFLKTFTTTCLVRLHTCEFKSKQTGDVSSDTIMLDDYSDDIEKTKNNKVKPMPTNKWEGSNNSVNNNYTAKKETEPFPYSCSEVGEMVDTFLFTCFMVFTTLVTFIILLILGVGAG